MLGSGTIWIIFAAAFLPRLIRKKLRILMVEDEAHDAALVEHALKDGGFEFAFRRVDTEEDFLEEIQTFQPSVILSDHGLPAFDGFAALSIAQNKVPDVPFIFVTGSLGEEMEGTSGTLFCAMDKAAK